MRDCALLDANGLEVSALIAAVASDTDSDQIVGQIIILDPAVSFVRGQPVPLAVNTDLMRAISSLFSQVTRTMVGYSEMMTRHLGAQGDDLGSEYALAIRNSIATLEASLTRLRPLTAGAASVEEVAEIVEFFRLTQDREISAFRGGG